MGPTPSMAANASSFASRSASMDWKCRARSVATRSPTLRIPKAFKKARKGRDLEASIESSKFCADLSPMRSNCISFSFVRA